MLLIVAPFAFGDYVQWFVKAEVSDVAVVAARCVYFETKDKAIGYTTDC